MQAFAYDTEERDITTNFCGEGQMIFEVSSFFNRTRSQENIQALTDCEGWQINYELRRYGFYWMMRFTNYLALNNLAFLRADVSG